MLDLPIFGPVVVVVTVLLLLAGSGFMSADTSAPAPQLSVRAQLEQCAWSFNRDRPLGGAAYGSARVAPGPPGDCLVRSAGRPVYIEAGGIWLQALPPVPVIGPDNADVVDGWLTLR